MASEVEMPGIADATTKSLLKKWSISIVREVAFMERAEC
jgi:hypothetical protein